MEGNSLTVVLVAHNEEPVIEDVVRGFYKEVIGELPGSVLLVAEDGSKDKTPEILKRLEKKLGIYLILGTEKKGYIKALRDAFAAVETDWVLFSDSDGQHDPADFWKLADKADDHDLVIGWKRPRRDPFHRVLMGKVFNLIVSALFKKRFHDIDCGFRLMKKSLIDDVMKDEWIFTDCIAAECALRALHKGYKVCEVPVSHFPREHGESNFNPGRLPKVVLKMFGDLWRLKKEFRMAG